MRLFIYFEDTIDISSHDKNDLILTSSYTLFKGYEDQTNIFLLNTAICDESPEISDAINQFFDQLPSEFTYFRNTYFMRVFRPIHAIIFHIEKLRREYPVNMLILKGGSDFKFITLIGGEGEGDHKFFKSSWLINSFLNQYFKGEMEIQWLNKQSAFFFNIFHFLRESIFLLKFIKRYVKTSFGKQKRYYNEEADKPFIFAFAYAPLQINHFENIFSESIKKRIIYISPVGRSLNTKKVHYYPSEMHDYIKAARLFSRVKRTITSPLIYKLNEKEIIIGLKTFKRSVRFNFIAFNANFFALEKFFSSLKHNPNSTFVTNMTFGEDIVLINTLAEQFKVPHYNFQVVAMAKMWYPQLRLADVYFLYSHQTFSFYRSLESSYHYYFPDINSIIRKRLKNKGLLTLALFTQPDALADRYLTFLEKFIPFINTSDNITKLIIKPHYRQNKLDRFRELIKGNPNIQLERKDVPPGDIIGIADFTMSITSSVLFEAIQLNCPGIILDLEGMDDGIIMNTCFPEINFRVKTYEELLHILHDPIEYIRLFQIRKAAFIQEFTNRTDINDIFHIREAAL